MSTLTREVEIYIDGARAGPWMGHDLSRLGCAWLARTKQDAVRRAPSAVADFDAWLWRNGEPDVAPASAETIATTIADVQIIEDFGQSGAAVGLFAPDLERATDDTIATSVRRLGYARRELLETTCGLPQDLLEVRPREKRSVRENMQHVANAQGFYLTRIFGWQRTATALPEPWPEDEFERLGWVLRRCVAELLAMPEELRKGVFEAQAPSEKWTARKMLRRFVEHELEHVYVVRRTLSELQPGHSDSRRDKR